MGMVLDFKITVHFFQIYYSLYTWIQWIKGIKNNAGTNSIGVSNQKAFSDRYLTTLCYDSFCLCDGGQFGDDQTQGQGVKQGGESFLRKMPWDTLRLMAHDEGCDSKDHATRYRTTILLR